MTVANLSTSSSEQLYGTLRELGFFRTIDNLPDLYQQAALLASHALLGDGEPRFACLPSFISAESVKPVPGKALILDIGGTSTKVGVRLTNSELEERWIVLFEKKNRDLRPSNTEQEQQSCLCQFADMVAQTTHEYASQLGLSLEEAALGIVWSNPMESILVEKGISATVCERNLYNKGEWFIEGLDNGADIGSVFLESFTKLGFQIQRLLVANDCPLTMKAGLRADGGVVASTGVNGTILADSDRGEIVCNAEIGQKFLIDPSLLTELDQKPEDGLTSRIECMIGGRFLPRLLVRYIRGLHENGCSCFTDIAAQLADLEPSKKWYIYRGKDLAYLERGDFGQFISRRENPHQYSRETLECLRVLAAALLQRSAVLTSVVVLGSVVTKAAEGRLLRVALDSRLAREVPAFWEQLLSCLSSQELLSSGVEAQLLEPLYTDKGSISVPMRGASHALDLNYELTR